MRFNKEDKVTLKERYTESAWYLIYGPKWPAPMPRFGEVYTVHKCIWEGGGWYISLDEIDPETGFDADAFEKVVSDRVLSEELKSVPEPFTI